MLSKICWIGPALLLTLFACKTASACRKMHTPPVSLVTAILTQRQGSSLTFLVELIRGDGRHLTRQWHTLAEARRALGVPLTATITMTSTTKAPKTGLRMAFYAYLTPERVPPGQTTILPGYTWRTANARSLTAVAANSHNRLQSTRPALLVNQLGARLFSKRKRAATALLGYGRAVIPTLENGLKHSVLTVRASCRRLLSRLRQQQGELIEQQVRQSAVSR